MAGRRDAGKRDLDGPRRVPAAAHRRRALDVLLIALLGDRGPARRRSGCRRCPPSRARSASAVAYLGVAQLAFNAGIVLPVVYPLLALLLGAHRQRSASHYILAAFERERVHDTFARFVPESGGREVLARTDEDLRLGGRAP